MPVEEQFAENYSSIIISLTRGIPSHDKKRKLSGKAIGNYFRKSIGLYVRFFEE